MSSAVKTSRILIFGASGLIGTPITTAILAAAPQHSWKVSVFTSPESAQKKSRLFSDLEARGAKIILGDLDSAEDVKAAYEGIDTVVSCLGRRAIEKQILLVQLADKHRDIKRFLPSEFGTDIEYGPKSKTEKPHQGKLKVRAALRVAEGLEHTFVVTGPYGDGHPGFPFGKAPPDMEETGTFDVANKKAVVVEDGNGKVSYTTKRDVGKLTVAALAHPKEARNRAVKVNSFTATPNEILAEFERQAGGPWIVSHTTLDRVREISTKMWVEGNPFAEFTNLHRIWAEGGTLYAQRDNGVIGMEGEDAGLDTLESCVRMAIEVRKETAE